MKTKDSSTFYCQRDIEGQSKCDTQCNHCEEYYKPLTKMKNINKSNKLIAEFMELSKLEELYAVICPTTGITLFLKTSELRYEKSWDWLMPVVEKIGNLNLSNNKELENKIDDIFPHCINYLFMNKECIYDKVIQFINWYNKK